ncbi:MAG TPA: hypothetical protein VJS88_05510 [Chthoniobacterales bacterium]|nr:hypothetical protein [Chthoniobacterales bacterium]
MHRRPITIWIPLALFVSATYAANPFLDAASDKPVSAQFRGTEWGEGLADDSPVTARLVTTRVAKTAWGAIFKMDFVDLKSKGTKKLRIRPDYYIVTDEQIVLLNEEDNDAAVKKIAAMDSPPAFEPGNVYGIAKGATTHQDGPWETTIEVKGDICTYLSSHNSGHFTKRVWQKGVGLIEHASGYGAHAYGHRLKRAK